VLPSIAHAVVIADGFSGKPHHEELGIIVAGSGLSQWIGLKSGTIRCAVN